MSHAGQGSPPKRELLIMNSHGEQVHVNESFCYVVQHYHFKTVYSSFLFLKINITTQSTEKIHPYKYKFFAVTIVHSFDNET